MQAQQIEEVPAHENKDEVSISDFQKLDLRVGTVISCERVPKSDKLLLFLIADGDQNRQILSGIAQYYNPDTLVGKQVVFIANLAPRKMRGYESFGMILCASSADGYRLISPDTLCSPGAEVS